MCGKDGRMLCSVVNSSGQNGTGPDIYSRPPVHTTNIPMLIHYSVTKVPINIVKALHNLGGLQHTTNVSGERIIFILVMSYARIFKPKHCTSMYVSRVTRDNNIFYLILTTDENLVQKVRTRFKFSSSDYRSITLNVKTTKEMPETEKKWYNIS